MNSLPQTPSTTSAPGPNPNLSLHEMLRVMDVAREMHRDRSAAKKALAKDDFRTALRDKLMRTAHLSGDPVTAAEVDAAIDTYLADRYRYADPPWSLNLLVAYLWVLRKPLLVLAAFGAIGAAILWGLSASSAESPVSRPAAPVRPAAIAPPAPVAALAATDQAAVAQPVVDQAESARREAQRLLDQIRAVSLEPETTQRAERLAAEVVAAGDDDPATATTAVAQMRQLHQHLTASYAIRLAQDSDGSNMFDRTFDAPSGGEKLSGRYVFVRAFDAQGRPVSQRIRNAETGREEIVTIWAERIPEEAYQRLKNDKLADGVLDEIDFAVKERGKTEIEMRMEGRDGVPMDRSIQITNW